MRPARIALLAALLIAARAEAQPAAAASSTSGAPGRAPRGAPSAPNPAPAAPAPSRVVILRAASDDAILVEAATRLTAELRAAGFEVVTRERTALEPAGAGSEPAGAAPGDLRASMERAAHDSGAFAAASISRSAGGAAADLWIVDRVTGKTVIRTVGGDGASTPSIIAVRAVELLQASLLEATARARATAPVPRDIARFAAPAPSAVPAPAPARLPLLAGFGMEGAVAFLQSTGAIGPAIGPALRVSLGAPMGAPASPGSARSAGALAARLTLAGPALAPALEGRFGTVSVRQELAALEIVYELPGGPIVPILSAGAGAYHLHAEGAPSPPLRAAAGDVWAVLAGAGAGLALRIGDRAAVIVDVNAFVTQPRPAVELAGEPLGTAGRPTFAAFLGLLARL
ncbi:MAG: hypothetical protein IT372_28865 [Polyangiaceae bacterium]|nr:hypothetical protein [Polyangiaceae bacterium]